MSLSPNPNSQPFYGSSVVNLDPPGTATNLGPASYDFFQFNDYVGKTLSGDTGSYFNIYAFRTAGASITIRTNDAFTSYLTIPASASGIATYGFLTNNNQVGWIRMDLGGFLGDITYLAAAFNDTPGGEIHIPQATTVPEPSSSALMGLGLLALGAAGIRKHRRRREQENAAAAG